jgi:elongation factor G
MALKSFAPSHIRNVALIGHGSAGKTSLAEAMLFVSGATTRLGKVDDHSSLLDFEPEEHRRLGSIATSLAWLVHDDHKINLLDTPGDANFIYDSLLALRGADAAVVVVSAPDGVEVQTERMFNEAVNLGLPRMVFINKMDRERADPERCLQELRDTFAARPVPLQVPIGAEHGFKGVISLFMRKALVYEMNGSGRYTKTEIPADMVAEVDAAWSNLVDAVVTTDDALLEKYLDTFDLSEDEVKGAFRKALKRGELLPVLYGSAGSCVSALALIELINWAFPGADERAPVEGSWEEHLLERSTGSDSPFTAQVIHTTVDEFSGKLSLLRVYSGEVPADNLVYNASRGKPERLGALFGLRGKEREVVEGLVCGDIVGVAKLKDTHSGETLTDPAAPIMLGQPLYPSPMMSLVIRPVSKADADKIKTGVERILEEDPTLSLTTEALTQQLVLQGMGQAHLEMAIERMRRKYKVNVDTDLPPVPYRETLARGVHNVEGKHKKQTGGAGQFGVCFINAVPLGRGEGFQFIDKIVGGAIPRQYVPSVEKGLLGRMTNGFLAGYPIVDVAIELIDGKYHPVDSKDVAFQIAGSKALREAFAQAGTVLLEPIMELEIVVPSEVMGDVMGDVTSRRGHVRGMEQRGRNTIIKAHCPMVEVQRFAPDLKGMTGGKGSFTMSLHAYEEVPRHLVDKIVHSSPFRRDDEED